MFQLTSSLFLFFFVLSCGFSQKALSPQKNFFQKRTLPLSLEIEREVSKFLIQEPDQELFIKLYKIHQGEDKLISTQKIKGIKIPTVIRLKVNESKEDSQKGPVYTVVIKLKVNSKEHFKGLLIIPHWRSTQNPLKIPLRKY